MRIDLKIVVDSDFHIASGEGVGRIVDSAIVRNDRGTPYVPAASLKGLSRWHAETVIELAPFQRLIPEKGHRRAWIDRLFGGMGAERGVLWFEDAEIQDSEVFEPQVHGRSARDPRTGRTRDNALFFYEDAAAATFVSTITCDRTLQDLEMLLLVTALRRVEAIGGQRRRGKGRASVTLNIEEANPGWQGVCLPGDTTFSDLANQVLSSSPIAGPSSSAPSQVDAESPPDDTASESIKTGGASARADTEDDDQITCLMLTALARQPIVATEDPETVNIIGALNYVPGSSVRGALAWSAIESFGWAPSAEPFRSIFTHEQVSFGPLYPCSEMPRRKHSAPFPVPRSMLTCKHVPGLMFDQTESAEIHGACNMLWGSDPTQRCQRNDCEAPLVPLDHFVQPIALSAGQESDQCRLRHVQPRHQTFQRTEIDDDTLSSHAGRLYSTEAIAAGTWLFGYVWGPPKLLDQVRQLWREDSARKLRVGKALTRGHGLLEVWHASAETDHHPHYPALLPVKHTWQQESELTLYLYSDTIAIDGWLRPITHLDKEGEILWQLLGGEDDTPFQNVTGYCSTRRVGGFNGKSGIPRSPDTALVAGSAWRFTWRDVTRQRRDEVIEVLETAVETGIGLRRGEGFGRVLINSPMVQAHIDQTGNAEQEIFSMAVGQIVPTDAFDDRRTPITRLPHHTPETVDEFVEKLAKKIPAAARVGFARLLHTSARLPDAARVLWGTLKSRLEWAGHRGQAVWSNRDLGDLENRLFIPPSPQAGGNGRGKQDPFRNDVKKLADEEVVLLKLIRSSVEDSEGEDKLREQMRDLAERLMTSAVKET